LGFGFAARTDTLRLPRRLTTNRLFARLFLRFRVFLNVPFAVRGRRFAAMLRLRDFAADLRRRVRLFFATGFLPLRLEPAFLDRRRAPPRLR